MSVLCHKMGSLGRVIMECYGRTALSRSVCPDDEQWRKVSMPHVQMADLERSSVCPPL